MAEFILARWMFKDDETFDLILTQELKYSWDIAHDMQEILVKAEE